MCQAKKECGGTYLEEAGHFVVAADNDTMRLSLYLPALIVVVRDVPATQSRLALPVLQQNEPNLCQRKPGQPPRVLKQKIRFRLTINECAASVCPA